MIDVQLLAKSVLDKSRIMSLATLDDGGLWVADVSFYADDKFNIYWSSSKKVRHSVALRERPEVAASITFNVEERSENIGLQLAGKARELGEGEFPFVEKYLEKFGFTKEKRPPQEFLGLDMCWYELRPTKMELIYQPEFDFGKQPVKLD